MCKIICDKCGKEIVNGEEKVIVSPHQTNEGTLFEKEVMCEECEKVYYPYFAISWNDN